MNLQELQRLRDKATAGPWVAERQGYIAAQVPGHRPNGEIIGRFHPSIVGLFTHEQEEANAACAVSIHDAVAMLEATSDFIEGHYKDGVCLICATNTTQSHEGCWVGGLEAILEGK